MSIAENIARVRANIAAAAKEAGRDVSEITLVGASKMNDADACRQAIAAGIDVLGENREQEMTKKLAEHAYDGAPLHFIGHLQRNKVRQVVGKAVLIHSVGSPELLEEIASRGVKICYVTLHVGLGTFRPVKEDEIENHEMHSEFCIIPEETAKTVTETKRNGGRIVCVGTTSCRTVESFANEDGSLPAASGWTDIFIYPGYKFKCLDALVTNFHLPESTLIMLVSALATREDMLRVYEHAVRERYRFFSFGDAMMIL